jgi:AbiV family abortive infection protein
MTKARQDIHFTQELIRNYQSAAVKNAEELLDETALLLENGHHARAYFLAVAAIEEIGKAAILYQASARNLKASDVQHRLNLELQSHSAKITGAFSSTLIKLGPAELRRSLDRIIGYSVALKRGREPSMYCDVAQENHIQNPSEVVRPTAAIDCLKLARACLDSTRTMLQTTNENRTTQAQDRMWALGQKTQKVWNEDDFGEYLMDYIEKNGAQGDIISPAVTDYYDNYLMKGKRFKK